MRILNSILIVTLFTVIIACSDDKAVSGEHVWKEQTDTIKKAEEVEATIMKAAEAQMNAVKEQTE